MTNKVVAISVRLFKRKTPRSEDLNLEDCRMQESKTLSRPEYAKAPT